MRQHGNHNSIRPPNEYNDSNVTQPSFAGRSGPDAIQQGYGANDLIDDDDDDDMPAAHMLQLRASQSAQYQQIQNQSEQPPQSQNQPAIPNVDNSSTMTAHAFQMANSPGPISNGIDLESATLRLSGRTSLRDERQRDLIRQGREETEQAVQSGQARIVSCQGCGSQLQAPMGFKFVYCPSCGTISDVLLEAEDPDAQQND